MTGWTNQSGRWKRRLFLGGLLLLGLSGCASMLFHPSHDWHPPSVLDRFDHQPLSFTSADGVILDGLRVAPKGCTPKGTLLFFHGNADNLSGHLGQVLWLVQAGYQVIAFDYRGYGRSGGEPDLAGMHRDGEAVLEQSLKLPSVDPERLAVLAQSLGGAVAIHTVATSPLKGSVRFLAVEGVFSGYRRIAQDKAASFFLTWPFQIPIRWGFDDTYSPDRFIAQVAPVPLLLIESGEDPVIPEGHAKRLYDLVKDPKGLWTVNDGAGHIEAFANPEVRGRFLEALEQYLGPPPEGGCGQR